MILYKHGICGVESTEALQAMNLGLVVYTRVGDNGRDF